LGAEQCDRNRYFSHHAGPSGHLERPPLLASIEGAFRVLQQTLDPVQVAEMKLHQALGKAQRWAGSHHIAREGREPALQDHRLSPEEGLAQVLLHQSRRPRPVARRQGVPDRVVDKPVLFAPVRSPSMQLRYLSGLDSLQPGTEEIAE
jgi:hypothetical protein